MFVSCDLNEDYGEPDNPTTDGTDINDGYDEPVIDEADINLEKLLGSWLLTETLYDSVSTGDVDYREFTLTFDKSGSVIKRYLDAEEIEMYSFRIVDEIYVCMESSDFRFVYKLIMLNDTKLKWQRFFSDEACYEQIFTRIEEIAINEVVASEGCINGEFSVGEGKKVYFSKGNLTYLPCENRFRFHENQYDKYNMMNNVYTTDKCLTWEYWIDLFFWGTSGWDGGVYDYRPGTRNNDNTYYYIKNDMSLDMVGEYAKADWGVYNKIENGGNKEGLWRVLSADEVLYLFGKRTDASNLYAFGYLGYTNGVFIFPDNFIFPNNIPVKTYKETKSTNPEDNEISLNDFALLEQLGAVFMPGGGKATYLAGTMITPTPGWYWTSTTAVVKSPTYVQSFYFDDEAVGMVETVRNEGHSVRLVQEVK